MPQLEIDGRTVEASDGTSIMDAAAQARIKIPALCYLPGARPLTACRLCIVEELKSKRTLASCSTAVADGMVIETNNEAIRAARKEVLQLLLSEHVGDCEAPCRRICPASLDVPLMMRKVAKGDLDGAARLAKEALILPATLGYVCTAPCERGCRRALYDEPLLIQNIHRRLAEEALARPPAESAALAAPTGKRVAIVGAGVAGLAAAWTLQRRGHACRIFEKADRPGGALRELKGNDLPRELFDAEVKTILRPGVELKTDCEIGADLPLEQLVEQYDAVLLACNDLCDGGHNVFRAKEFSLAVKSVAQGKQTAIAVDRFLRGLADTHEAKPFDCRLGKIQDSEKDLFARHRIELAELRHGRNSESVKAEALRCLHCDCIKAASCKLRQYATEYGAAQFAYRRVKRPPIQPSARSRNLIYEPGKCIRCGLCVTIAERAREALGLGFVQRGFDVRVQVPFGRPLEEGLTVSARECVAACPTGALAFLNEEERDA